MQYSPIPEKIPSNYAHLHGWILYIVILQMEASSLKKFNTALFRQLMAVILCVAMVLPLCVTGVSAAQTESNTIVNTQQSQTEVKNSSTSQNPLYTVIAGSDFQNDSGDDAGAEVVENLLNAIHKDHATVNGFLFCGDYSHAFTEAGEQSGYSALVGAVNKVYPGLGDSGVYVQGNHDPYTLTTSGAHDAEGYGVYVINEEDYMWASHTIKPTDIQSTADNLSSYLNGKINDKYTKPIFVVSHLPLHYNMRTAIDGDGSHANYIFDVLNEAGAKGLNIIFMFGHNHSNGWDDYLGGAAIYLERGDSINIAQASSTEFDVETLNFTYMNAGYVGYYRGVNEGSERDLTMTVFEIYEDEVRISRYCQEGLHDLKSVGVRNSNKNETAYAPDTRTYTSPRSVGIKNSDSDNGVTVQANGISDVIVTVGNSAKPNGFSYYQTYDIKVPGFRVGTTATVTLPASGADASKPTVVIDHERNELIPVEIVNGNVTFTTDHFSLYTVAQDNVTTYTATGTLENYLQRVTSLDALENGVPYVISDFSDNWNQYMLTNIAGSYKSSSGTTYPGLLLEGIPDANTAHLWYLNDGKLVYGSADSAQYLLLTSSGVTLGAYNADNAAYPVANAYPGNYGPDDLGIGNTKGNLNRRGGRAENNVATYYGNAMGSYWHFDKVIANQTASLTVTPDRSYVLAGKTISLVSAATIGTQSKSDYTVAYSTSDPSIAVVSSSGIVTGYKTGQVTITATLTAVGGYALVTSAVVEIPLSVVTLTKNEIVVTGSGTIGQYLIHATGETLKEGVPYLIQSAVGSDKAVLTNNVVDTKDSGKQGLELVTENDFSHVWYYSGGNLLYGSPVPDNNYMVYSSNKVSVGNEGVKFDTVTLSGTNTYTINNSYGQWLNRYGGSNYYTAYVYSSGSKWYFSEIASVDATLTAIFPQSVLVKGSTMDIAAVAYINGKLVNSEANYTVTWASSNTAVAQVNEKGQVTAKGAGNATITATMTVAEGYTLDIPAVVTIPLTVTADSEDTGSVTASTVLTDFVTGNEALTPGTVSGPYVITNDASKRVLTGRTMLNTDADWVSKDGKEGLALLLNQGCDHVWYYDGTYLRYGAPFGLSNYLVYKNGIVTLGSASDAQFDLLSKMSNNNAYGIGTSSISGSPTTNRYLNQYGSADYNVVGLYSWKWDSNGTLSPRSGSCWWLNKAYKDMNVSLSVTPGEAFLRAGETVTLKPTVWFDGLGMSSYTIEWKSSDSNVVTVNNGIITTKAAGGLAVITATLTAVDGLTLPTPISVEIPIQVLRISDAAGSITMTYNTGGIAEQTTDIQVGVPYALTNYIRGKWLTGYNINASNIGNSHREGLGLSPINDMSHVWYYDGTYLKYGDPDGTDNYLAICPTSEGNFIKLADMPESGDDHYLLDTLTPDATNAIAYNISASGLNSDQYLHQGFAYTNNNVVGYSSSDNRSEWLFYEVLPSREYSMTITPSAATVYAGHTVVLNPTVLIDGVETDAYRIEWTVSDSEKADIYQGVVTGLVSGNINARARLTYIDGSLMNEKLYVDVPVQVVGITSATLNKTIGSVAQRASAGAYTGVDMTVTYEDGYSEVVPVTVGMLRQGNNRISAYNAGTYEDLEVTYGGITLTDAMNLIVIGREALDQPAFPEEGSVVINKTGVGVDFQSSGIAQIELGTMGVPGKKGADLIVMLDVSSSMNNERILVLIDCLNDMVGTLKQNGADGEPMDIRLAVASFNGYYNAQSQATTSPYYIHPNDTTVDNSIRTDANRSANDIYTGSKALNAGAFVNVADLKDNPFYCSNYSGVTSEQYHVILRSGTNYDYAFDAIYQLGDAINKANEAANEDRDLIVLFMSDGAPFQYNYFGSASNSIGSKYWNNWLTGTMTDDMYAANANKAYYNEDGLHWMAEAIKGDPNQNYKVIRKNDTRDTDHDNFIDVPGLGATMYSIGFCLENDNQILEETMHEVIRNVATTPEYYFDADHQHELRDAFETVTRNLSYAATDAYFLDEMGEHYDIQLKQHSYETYEGTKLVTKTIDPTIQIKAYSVYTYQDAIAGICEKSQIGARKLDANGKEIYTVVETVSFNANGTQAYSSALDSGNVLNDGVICAKNFWYNTTASAKNITLADGSTYALPAETFYWNIGNISTTEMTMTYYVYLTESMEGNRHEGVYPTNKYADLHYVDYLGKSQEKDAPSPVLPWQQARVGYGFYLVDRNGNPIVNQTTGETGSFEQAVKITQIVYQDMLLNADESDLPADILASGKLPEGYVLFDSNAEYIVKLNSNGSGYYIIASGTEKQTTYVTGLTNGAITNTTTEPGTQVDTDSFATANTVVWFAVQATVQCVPDTVVIDYGLKVEIDVLANDVLMEGFAQLKYVRRASDIPGYTASGKELWVYLQDLDVTSTSEIGTYKSNNGMYGRLIVEGNKVVYKPWASDNASSGYSNAMKMEKEDEFAYAVKYTGSVGTVGYYYSSVTVIPATTIYFEDNFLTYKVYQYNKGETNHTDISTYSAEYAAYQWKKLGTTISDTQAEDRPGEYSFPKFDANNIYGYDGAYTDMATYSLGSTQKFTAKQEGNKITYGTASFTFTGTGFDVISLTDNISGAITVEVRKHGETANYKTFLVDNYYGYVYRDTNNDGVKEWTPAGNEEDGENPLYQVPVIKASGLDYGTYDVIITISYAEFFDHNDYGWYNFYMDAVRIYDPANDGDGNQTIEDAYVADGEGWPEYFELRNLVLGRDDLNYSSEDGNTSGAGIVFIDNVGSVDEVDVADYKNYGPNNELYLASGQSITFDLNVPGDVAAIHMAMKSVGGTAKIKYYTLDSGAPSTATEIKTATDLYYDISDFNGKTVVITNVGSASDAILSITNVKIAYQTAHTDSVEQTYFTASAAKVKEVVESLNKTEEDTDTPEISGTVFDITAASLSLEDEIRVNFYFTMDTSKLTREVSEIALLIWDSEADATAAGRSDDPYMEAERVVEGYVYDSAQKLYMVQSDGIAPKNLGDDLHVRIYLRFADGSCAVSAPVKYSPKTYAYNRLKNSTDDKMKALCVALLNYGAEAQKYFSYKTDTLMNADLTSAQKALVKAYSSNLLDAMGSVSDTKVGEFGKTSDRTGYGQCTGTVSFDGALAINYYFPVPDGYTVNGDVTFYYWTKDAYDNADVLTAENATGVVTMLPSKVGYWAQVGGFAAKDMDDTIYAAAIYTDSKGIVHKTGVFSYSIAFYCTRLDSSDTEGELAKAATVYGYHAKQFFG